MTPENLPIIPHEYIDYVDCPGSLIVRSLDDDGWADIVCNECGVVILDKVPVKHIEAVMDILRRTPRVFRRAPPNGRCKPG